MIRERKTAAMIIFRISNPSAVEWVKLRMKNFVPFLIWQLLLIFVKCLKYFSIYFIVCLALIYSIPVFLTLAFLSTIIINLLRVVEHLEPMAGADMAMTLRDSGSKPIITGILQLKGKPDIQKIRESFKEKVLSSERKLKKYICSRMGYMFWKDEQPFDILRHIYERSIEESNDSMENNVQQFAEDRIHVSFPERVSPWEIVILNSRKDQDEHTSYVVIRVHHAIGDGISLVSLLVTALADERHALPLQKRVAIPKQTIQVKLHQIAVYLKCLICYPIYLYKHFLYWKSNTLQADNLCGTKLSLVSEELDFVDLKLVKKASKTSISAVVMTSILESLRSYFIRTMKSSGFPGTISAIIPVILKLPEDKLELSNVYTIGMEEFSTTRMDIQERLIQTYKILEAMKRSPYLYLLTGWGMNILPYIPTWIINWIPKRSNVVFAFTNIPGPSEHLSLWEHQLLQAYTLVPNKGNTGITVSMLNYAGAVRLTIVADTAVVASRDKLKIIMDDLMKNLKQLKKDLLC